MIRFVSHPAQRTTCILARDLIKNRKEGLKTFGENFADALRVRQNVLFLIPLLLAKPAFAQQTTPTPENVVKIVGAALAAQHICNLPNEGAKAAAWAAQLGFDLHNAHDQQLARQAGAFLVVAAKKMGAARWCANYESMRDAGHAW